LLEDEPVFAEAIAELDPIFVEKVGFSLHKIIANGESVSGDGQVQPVLMGLSAGADRGCGAPTECTRMR